MVDQQSPAIAMTPAHNQLVQDVQKGSCILFLGAGVHAPPPPDSPYHYPPEQRPPLGKALSEILATKYGFHKKHPDDFPDDLQRVALYIERTHGLGRRTLVNDLRDLLRAGKSPSPALMMLARLPFKIIVTTNYDRLIETALQQCGKEPAHFIYNPETDEPTEDMVDDPTVEQPLLFKMHGDLDKRNSIVITDEDYIQFVQRMSDKDQFHPIPQTVRFRMQKWPTLFVGYSLRDYNLRLLFRTLRWRIDQANFPAAFSIDQNPDPLILDVWQNERRLITFVADDLWTFIPWLYKEIQGENDML